MNRETVKTQRRYNQIARFYDFLNHRLKKGTSVVGEEHYLRA